MKTYDFLVVGAGIFGVTTAIELRRRGFSVGILNPGSIPHPLAASTDISKIVRMEYGSDLEYMDMVEHCLHGWRAWNEQFGTKLFHEVGFLLATKQPLEPGVSDFEYSSYSNLLKKGYAPQRLSAADFRERFPAFNSEVYCDGFFNPVAGYCESGRVVETLAAHASDLGVEFHCGQTAHTFEEARGRVTGLRTREFERFSAGQVVVCAGHFTPHLLPDLQQFMKVTGHPVFHLKPSRPEIFEASKFPVFAADISKTGWYGFPLHPTAGVVKIANHGKGVELHPEHDPRVVTEEDVKNLRYFLKESLPALAGDPIVSTRRCLYCDTRDGHFWIDRHPEKEGLTIGAGGSGHAMKMAPVVGELIAAAALGEPHRWSVRHRWRSFGAETRSVEEARFSEA